FAPAAAVAADETSGPPATVPDATGPAPAPVTAAAGAAAARGAGVTATMSCRSHSTSSAAPRKAAKAMASFMRLPASGSFLQGHRHAGTHRGGDRARVPVGQADAAVRLP